jgi:DNA primase
MPLSFEKKVAFEHAKEEIRSRINIADIIGRHVALKPAGQNLKGLCPFHKEKTPSFTVTPAKGIFYCFGCHKGGDVFTFLMEFEGLSFSEALHMLADEAGVKLEQPRSRNAYQSTDAEGIYESTKGLIPKNEMLKINQMAVDFYYSQTRGHRQAIDYFLGRGLSREIIKEFRLGYAPPGWSEFLSFTNSQGVPQSSLVQCGLAIAKPDNKAYDRFRDRIMFPIYDTSKRPIGFGGRGLTPDAQPKYLNSPETFLYQKNKTLYGLHASQYHIKQNKSAIIVEGYMDFLSLYQAGIKNAIATSGTALTDGQARIIQRFTNKIYLVFDGDSAGINAAQRAIFVLAPYNFDMRVLILPDEEDPDSYIKKHGQSGFLALLNNAFPFMKFIIEKAMADKSADTPQGKSQVLAFLVPLAQSITDSVVRQEFKKQIVDRLHITDASAYEQFDKFVSLQNKIAENPDNYCSTLEGNFMRILLTTPSIIAEARQFIRPETFTDQFSNNLYSMIVRCYDENQQLNTLVDRIADPEVKRIVSLMYAKGVQEENALEELRHTVVRLQSKYLRFQIRQLSNRLKFEPLKRTALMEQLKDFTTQLKELETQ